LLLRASKTSLNEQPPTQVFRPVSRQRDSDKPPEKSSASRTTGLARRFVRA
jgi:hypothetical protein